MKQNFARQYDKICYQTYSSTTHTGIFLITRRTNPGHNIGKEKAEGSTFEMKKKFIIQSIFLIRISIS